MGKLTDAQLACKCCGRINFSARARERHDYLVHLLPFTARVNSACRCVTHNLKVGGKSNSAHVFTMSEEGPNLETSAIDYGYKNSWELFWIIKAAIESGATRIGISKNFVHVDYDKDKPQEVVWLY